MPSIEKRGARSWRLIVEAGMKLNEKGKLIRDKRTKAIKVDDPALLRTKKKLNDFLDAQWWEFKGEVDAGTYVKPSAMSFKEFTAKTWWDNYAIPELAESTRETCRRNLETHIYPHFGHLVISEIKTMHIVEFKTYLGTPAARKDGKIGDDGQPLCLENNTQRTIYRTLHGVFSKAVEWKVLGTNPCDGVKWPEKSEPDIQVYEEDEMNDILDALDHVSDTWRLLILGTFLGGFRRGEMVAVELNDLDFEADTLMIDENIPMKLKGKYIIKDPKTKSSTRAVPMPHWYMEELALYVREWKKRKLTLGAKWRGGDRQFLFHTGYGLPYHPNTPTNWWNKFLKDNGFRHVKLHGLRHTSATHLLEQGATVEAVKDRLGHASRRSTEIYLHTTKAMEKAAATKFDQFKPQNRQKKRPQSVPTTD